MRTDKSDLQHCPQCNVDLTSFGAIERLSFCPQCRHPIMLLAGKYRLKKVLAEGGFGKVYMAERIQLKRDAERVVKVIKSEVFAMEGMEERFWREVQVTSALSQRSLHIVRIYDDFGSEPGFGHYYVMEYLRGKPLKDYLESQPQVPYRIVIHMLKQVCEGLRIAHREGVIHRDLKPDNLFVISEDDGTYFLKIIDWGIAKPVDWNSVGQDLTQGAVGTPRYMAPEQCLGQAIDHRADIYSLGVIMYEMLTGKPLFQLPEGEGSAPLLALLHAHVAEDPIPISKRCPSLQLPPGLESAVMTALAKDPNKRFKSVELFGDVIASCDELASTRAELKGLPTTDAMAYDHTMLAALDATSSEQGAAPSTQPLPRRQGKALAINSQIAQDSTRAGFDADDSLTGEQEFVNPWTPSRARTAAPRQTISPLDISGVDRSYPGLLPHRRRSRRSPLLLLASLLALLVIGLFGYLYWQSQKRPTTPRQTVATTSRTPQAGQTKSTPIKQITPPAALRRAPPVQPLPRVKQRRKRHPKARKRRHIRSRRPLQRRAGTTSPKPRPRQGRCATHSSSFHWIYGRLRRPKGRVPHIHCHNKRLTIIREGRGFCIAIPPGAGYTKCIARGIRGYRPCESFSLHSRMKSASWTFQLDTLELMGMDSPCFQSR